jgi:hypothetical protein
MKGHLQDSKRSNNQGSKDVTCSHKSLCIRAQEFEAHKQSEAEYKVHLKIHEIDKLGSVRVLKNQGPSKTRLCGNLYWKFIKEELNQAPHERNKPPTEMIRVWRRILRKSSTHNEEAGKVDVHAGEGIHHRGASQQEHGADDAVGQEAEAQEHLVCNPTPSRDNRQQGSVQGPCLHNWKRAFLGGDIVKGRTRLCTGPCRN